MIGFTTMSDTNDPSPQPDILTESVDLTPSGTFNDCLPPREQIPQHPAEQPRQLGRYLIQSTVGRGGLGVVFRALDLELQRVVAIKQIHTALSSSEDILARFQREATAVARLNHPNIIRIYEIGLDAGQPFLVLEYVEGLTLAQWLAQAPLAQQTAARLMECISRAIGHAHQSGIIHRDLKPSNVLLERRSRPEAETLTADLSRPTPGTWAELNPKIADFGLAKQLGEDNHVTLEGAILGTPSYMAPEQAAGTNMHVGPACDIWALGAMLYECLVGRPPFRGANTLETLQQVQTHEPLSPRTIQPSVSRDLSVIAMKCLEKDPRRRYESAEALAEDLRRFLEGRPIVARPVGPVTQGLKWASRNRTLAALLALALLIPPGVAAGFAYHAQQLQLALNQTIQQEQRANAEKIRADGNYRHARAAMSQMLARVNDRRYHGIPRLMELRKSQAESALQYYSQVAEQRRDQDPEARADAVVAGLEAGRLAELLGQEELALTTLRNAHTAALQLQGEFPTQRQYARLAAEAKLLMGNLAVSRGHPAEGLPLVIEAEELFRGLVSDSDLLQVDQNHLGNALIVRATICYLQNQHDEAATFYRECHQLRTQLVANNPHDAAARRSLADVSVNLSLISALLKQSDLATKYHLEADGIMTDLLKLDPTDRSLAIALATSRVNWSYTERTRGASRVHASLAELIEIKLILERLLALEPDDRAVRIKLRTVYGGMAENYESLQRFREAATYRDLVVQYTDPPEQRFNRWFSARDYCAAGDFATAFRVMELNLQTPDPIPLPELQDGLFVTLRAAALMGQLSALSGAAIQQDQDQCGRLLVSLLERYKKLASQKEWLVLRSQLFWSPGLRFMTPRADVQAALVLK